MESRFKQLNSEYEHKDTVLSFFSSIFKVGEFVLLASEIFRDIGLGELDSRLYSQGKGRIPLGRDKTHWINDGKECEILSPNGKGWQKGKVRVRVTLEFCPDEPDVEETLTKSNQLETIKPESSLDEIRRLMGENS